MVVTREMVLRFIARHEPVSTYPLIETGQYGRLSEFEKEGLVTITGIETSMGEIRLTDKGRAELAKLTDLPKS